MLLAFRTRKLAQLKELLIDGCNFLNGCEYFFIHYVFEVQKLVLYLEKLLLLFLSFVLFLDLLELVEIAFDGRSVTILKFHHLFYLLNVLVDQGFVYHFSS